MITTANYGGGTTGEAAIAADEARLDLFPEPEEMTCMCFDGEAAA